MYIYTAVCSDKLLFSCLVVFNSLWPHGLQHIRPPCPSPSPKLCPSSCPLHWWWHPAISSSDALFSFCPQSFPASGTFPIWVSCLHEMTKILELQLQHQSFQWVFRVEFLWDWLVLISLRSKGLWRVFSSTTIQKHQFFMVQLSYPYMTTEKPKLWLYGSLSAKSSLCFLMHCLGL